MYNEINIKERGKNEYQIKEKMISIAAVVAITATIGSGCFGKEQ